MEEIATICSVSGPIIPIIIDFEVPIDNIKCTSYSAVYYTKLSIADFDRRRYVIAKKQSLFISLEKEENILHISGTVPIGAIVHVQYSTGSWKHVLFKFSKFFIVTPGSKCEQVYQPELCNLNKNYTLRSVNIQLLQSPSEADILQISSFFQNTFNALPSKFDPVCILYHFFTSQKQKTEETITEGTELKEKLTELKKKLI